MILISLSAIFIIILFFLFIYIFKIKIQNSELKIDLLKEKNLSIELTNLKKDLEEKNLAYIEDKNNLQTQNSQLQSEKKYLEQLQNIDKQNFQNELHNLNQNLTQQKQYYENLLIEQKNRIEEFKNDLLDKEKIKKELKLEFENLSQKILEVKTQDFEKEQHKTLEPFKKEIKDFKEAFEKLKTEQTQERTTLITEIKVLKDLNQALSQEASNLTKALKGESKTRGNWGEMILEKMLQANGFIEGQNYHKQKSFRDEDSNKYFQPDIIVDLPDDRCIVIDAKLNLNAYDELISYDDKENIQKSIKALILGVKAHLKELETKKYHEFLPHKSPDFTIMFIPIEGAFIEVMREDKELFNKAYDSRVVIASPSTLMSILMTINNLWKNEQIDKDYKNIINKLDKLRTKMDIFCKYMDEIGDGIITLQKRYEKANKSLQTGSGNIIGQIRKIKEISQDETKSIVEDNNII